MAKTLYVFDTHGELHTMSRDPLGKLHVSYGGDLPYFEERDVVTVFQGEVIDVRGWTAEQCDEADIPYAALECDEWWKGDMRPATPADILAVLAPEPAWKLVMQEDDEGCAVACLAMVTGQQYADVLETLPQPGLTHGLSDAFVMHWLHERGFYTRRTWDNTPHRRLLLTRPSTCSAHVFSVRKQCDQCRSEGRTSARKRPPAPRKVRSLRTHCRRGHAFTEANTYVRPEGVRACKRCRADMQRSQYHKNPQGLNAKKSEKRRQRKQMLKQMEARPHAA